MVGVLWSLAWIGLVGAWVIAGAILFFIGLGTFGIGLVIGAIAISLFIVGARIAAVRNGPRQAPGALHRLVDRVQPRGAGDVGPAENPAWATVTATAVAGRRGCCCWGSCYLPRRLGLGAGVRLHRRHHACRARDRDAGGLLRCCARVAFTVAGIALVWYWLLPLPFSLFTPARSTRSRALRRAPASRPGDLGQPRDVLRLGRLITASATLVIIFNSDAILRSREQTRPADRWPDPGPQDGHRLPAGGEVPHRHDAGDVRPRGVQPRGHGDAQLQLHAALRRRGGERRLRCAGHGERPQPNRRPPGRARGSRILGTDLSGVGASLVASRARVSSKVRPGDGREYDVLGVDDEFLQTRPASAQVPRDWLRVGRRRQAGAAQRPNRCRRR